MLNRTFFLASLILLRSLSAHSQIFNVSESRQKQYTLPATASDEAKTASEKPLTLTDCIRFALKNQPAINQSYIDQAIAGTNNALALSAWLPQLTGNATFQHYFELPTVFLPVNGVSTPVHSGVTNSSIPSLNLTQTLFSNQVLLAAKATKLNTRKALENTEGTKIELVSSVTKAFYDLLNSIARIGVYKEDTARLAKNHADAYNRYVSGIVDKVDYKQASISLNNARAALKTATESVNAKYAALRQLMGLQGGAGFKVSFDTAQLMQEIVIDTLASLNFEKRIEYQQLQTARLMQRETSMYYQLGFLPSLSGFYTYNYQFQNNNFSDLYSKAYPNSLFGFQLSFPIFTGFRRMENVRKAHLMEQRLDWDEVNLKLRINTEYQQALAQYKSNLYFLHAQGENGATAREVYQIVKLQYSEGVKTYLDVIVAESDLQTAEINYLNALFQLLESKVDLERAMGGIDTNM